MEAAGSFQLKDAGETQELAEKFTETKLWETDKRAGFPELSSIFLAAADSPLGLCHSCVNTQ